MFEMRLNTTRLEHKVMTKHLKITRIIIKVGLRERGERDANYMETEALVMQIMELPSISQSLRFPSEFLST